MEEKKTVGLFSKLFGKGNEETPNIDAREYDWDNIHDICIALGCLVGCAADSYVFIPIQDKNEAKGWEPMIFISMHLDKECGVNKLESMEDYKKLAVPDEIASFLLNNPFSLGEDWNYGREFKPNNPYPSTSGIASELAKDLERGCKMSPKVQMNLLRYRVEVPNNGTVSLEVR